MPFYAPDNFSFRPYIFPPPTGGMTFTQNTDADCVQMWNVEMQRDKFVRPRLGAYACHAPGAMGGTNALGLDVIAMNNSVQLVVVKKDSATAYYTDTATITSPATFGTIKTFSLPAAPTFVGDPTTSTIDWQVHMATATSETGTLYGLLCHSSWSHIVSWTGGATSSYIAASPAAVYITFHSDNRVWAIGTDRKTLYYSDVGKPETWPTTNKLGITPAYGPMKALLSLGHQLVIFCKTGVLVLTGDPDDDTVNVTVSQPNIGIDFPGTLSLFGNTSYFIYQGTAYQFSGTVSMVSDAIRGMFAGLNSCGALGEFGYIVKQPNAPPPSPCFSWVYDRIRYGMWNQWVYPTTCGLGASQNNYPVIKYYDTRYFMTGGDGNVYAQMFWSSLNAPNPTDTFPAVPDTSADGSVKTPVNVRIVTRMVDLGDNLLTKAWRAVQMYGSGTNVSLTLGLFDHNHNQVLIPMMTNGTLPCELHIPAVDGSSASPVTEFNEAQLLVSGDYLYIKKAEVWWRPVRYGQISYEGT